jgi:phosphoribosylformylglycinamidine (FGAM) synthase-like enzyme
VDKTRVTEQYDRHVRGDTVLATPDDAGVIRVDADTGLGVALASTPRLGSFCACGADACEPRAYAT